MAAACDKRDLCYITPKLRRSAGVDEAFHGSASDQFTVASYFLEGSNGFQKNPERAFYWLTQSCNNGDVRALNQLGVCYVLGSGTEKEEHIGFELIKLAAELGDDNAMVNAAMLSLHGRGTSINHKLAADYLQKAAEAGNGEAAYQLGLMYLNGSGVQQDESNAFRCFTRAADTGVAEAQAELAQCYAGGMGTEADAHVARKYWLMASSSGDTVAQRYVGEKFLSGTDGFTEDHVKARRYLTRAAEAGDAQAQYKLALCCDHGIGGPQDKFAGQAWLEKAARQQHPEAVAELDFILKDQENLEREFKEMMLNLRQKFVGHDKEPAIMATENPKKLSKRRSFINRLLHKNKDTGAASR